MAANGLTFEAIAAGPERGELVLLLHGFPQTCGSWTRTVRFLGDSGRRAVAPNLRGYSAKANPQDAGAYAMSELIGDVLGMADFLRHERFHVVGHDWGGALAWAVAAAHPERVVTVTSVSTPHPMAMLESMRKSTQLLRSSYMGFFRIPRVPEVLLGAANFLQLSIGSRAGGLPASAWERDRRHLREVGLRGPLNWYRGAFRPGDRVGKVSVPALYVWGSNDLFLGRRAAELTQRHATGEYRFVELKAGHFIPDRNSTDLHRVLGEHLDAHRAQQDASASSVERTGRAAAKPRTTKAATLRKATTPRKSAAPKTES